MPSRTNACNDLDWRSPRSRHESGRGPRLRDPFTVPASTITRSPSRHLAYTFNKHAFNSTPSTAHPSTARRPSGRPGGRPRARVPRRSARATLRRAVGVRTRRERNAALVAGSSIVRASRHARERRVRQRVAPFAAEQPAVLPDAEGVDVPAKVSTCRRRCRRAGEAASPAGARPSHARTGGSRRPTADRLAGPQGCEVQAAEERPQAWTSRRRRFSRSGGGPVSPRAQRPTRPPPDPGVRACRGWPPSGLFGSARRAHRASPCRPRCRPDRE